MTYGRYIICSFLLVCAPAFAEPPTIKSVYADDRGFPTVEIFNPSNRVFSYSGYNATNPIFAVESLEGDKWVDASPGWCGNGLDIFEIPPRSTITVILVGLDHADKSKKTMRLCFRFFAGSKSDVNEKTKALEVHSSEFQFPLHPKG